MSRLMNIISVFVLVGMLLITVGAYLFNAWLQTPIHLENDKVLSIQSGDTLSKIAYSLASENILDYPRLFIVYAKITERTDLEVGEYKLSAYITPDQLLKELQFGEVLSYKVTLVEGKTFKDFLAVLQREEKINSTLAGKTFKEIKMELALEIDHPEGWFYPDTYQYTANTSDADILIQAHTKMKKVLSQEWEKREKNLPYKNSYEALIMASIVEKETGVAYERPEIAGVFVRRLNKGMRLQTDPTIIYGLGDDYKGNIRRKHLRQKTPYNTYVIDGLPPTPIAMPGQKAINAALNPAEGKTLFFVAKGDGSHQFSETLSQHNKAVQKYQIKNRAENYRSAPSKTIDK